MIRISLRLTTLILLCSSFCSSLAYAGKWYHLEVVVFEHLDPSALNAEVWSQNTGTPTLTKAQQLHSDKTLSQDLLLRPQDKWVLKEQVRRLRNDKRYHVLAHTAWQQLMEPGQPGIPVHIKTGSRFELPKGGLATPEALPMTVGPFPLEGVIQVGLNKFLQVKCDLVLTKPIIYDKDDTIAPLKANKASPWFGPSSSQLQGFRHQQSKKIRSNELHYLDHPLLGVLIKIIPMEGDITSTESPEGASALLTEAPDDAEEIG